MGQAQNTTEYSIKVIPPILTLQDKYERCVKSYNTTFRYIANVISSTNSPMGAAFNKWFTLKKKCDYLFNDIEEMEYEGSVQLSPNSPVRRNGNVPHDVYLDGKMGVN